MEATNPKAANKIILELIKRKRNKADNKLLNDINSIASRQNYEKKSNHASFFDGEYIEVGYQPELNPSSFTLVGWIKPNNDLHTMEGILSSQYNNVSSSKFEGGRPK